MRSTRSQPGCRPASPSSRPRTARRRRARCSRGSSAPATGSPGTTRAPTSPRASRPPSSPRPDADLGLLEVDEFALPEVMRRVRPRVVSLGNLFRDQLDRYGELEHIAERWRAAVAALPPRSTLDRQCRRSPRRTTSPTGARGALRFGVDDPRLARPALQHAADSKYCVRCGSPYAYAAAYVGHLGDYRCPACGHAPAAARPRGAVDRPAGARRLRSSISSRRPERPGFDSPSPVSTTSTTLSPRRPSRSRSTPRSTRSSRGSARSRRRSAGSSGSTPATGGS